MPASSWLFGEITPDGESITVTVTAQPPQPVTVASDPVYLHDVTPALSLLAVLEAAIDAHPDIAPGDTSVYLRQDRRIVIECDQEIAIAWGSATQLRDALGFTADLPAAEVFVAPNVSPYLWCPGLTEISEGRLGAQGIPVYDTQVGGGGGFIKPIMTTHNYNVVNTLEWRNVDNTGGRGRVWEDDVGGEWIAFWRAVLVAGGQWTHYRRLTNDETSTAELVLTTPARRGPYIWTPPPGAVRFDYDRAIPNVEARSNVRVPCRQVIEL